MATSDQVWEKLSSGRDYRKEIVSALLKRGTALQIQGMMKKKGWTQAQLAEHSGLTQGVISRARNPAYGNLTFNTIIEIAAGFDVAFIGRFVPFTEFEKWVETMPKGGISFEIPDFETEKRKRAGNLLDWAEALKKLADSQEEENRKLAAVNPKKPDAGQLKTVNQPLPPRNEAKNPRPPTESEMQATEGQQGQDGHAA